MKRSNGRKFCFESPRWHLDAIELTQVVRQSDSVFADVLNRIRTGRATWQDEQWINCNASRFTTNAQRALFPGNKDCKSRNELMLAEVSGELVDFERRCFCRLEDPSEEHAAFVRIDEHLLPCQPVYDKDAAEVVKIKVGCRVRCTRNIYCSDDDIECTIRTANGQLGTVKEIWYTDEEASCIVVNWDALSDRVPAVTHAVRRATWRKEQEFECRHKGRWWFVTAISQQFPLCVAYAGTVHSSQGCTIRTEFDLKTYSWNSETRGPVPGSAYVALSRATRISNVRLIQRFYRNHAVADPKVRAFYAGIVGV